MFSTHAHTSVFNGLHIFQKKKQYVILEIKCMFFFLASLNLQVYHSFKIYHNTIFPHNQVREISTTNRTGIKRETLKRLQRETSV